MAGLGGTLELTAVFDGDVRVPLVLDAGAGAGRPAVRTEADMPEDKPSKRTKKVRRDTPLVPVVPSTKGTAKSSPRVAMAAKRQGPAPRATTRAKRRAT